MSGIPIDRTRIILYILSGLAAGIAAIFINSRVATGDPNSGVGFEFDVIVAVLVGLRHQVHDEADPEWLGTADVRRGLAAVQERGSSTTCWCGLASSQPRSKRSGPSLISRSPADIEMLPA